MFRQFFYNALLLPVLLLFSVIVTAQSTEEAGWQLLDPSVDQVNGTGVEQAYTKLKDRSSSTVVVAIIDSGVDVDHEDLEDNIWVNEDEVPNNNIDDDNNGYIDDMHGWNFLGNADGDMISGETLEVTRLYAKYREYFKDKDLAKLNKKDKKLYEVYQEYKKTVEKERSKAQTTLATIEMNEKVLLEAIGEFKKAYPNQELTKQFMQDFDPGTSENLGIIKQMFDQIQSYEAEVSSIDEIEKDIKMGYAEAKESFRNKAEYWYNPDFNSRQIIGDDYSNSYEKGYGNSNVVGSHNFHGTHVAGIVGAVRGNDVGVMGIADNVQLMVLRAVPDGDEHDKDIANAILYAVNNGASVINMSFGKGQSWDKQAVDKAVKHAMKNDVLIVHAAGNEADNNDEVMHFPVPEYEKTWFLGKKRAKNWIEVGALNSEPGENAIASFSNYGPESVDIFAPGGMIMSTAPDNAYQPASGTSMASPVVAGVAALLRSYFPSLTAEQVKEVIVNSAMPYDQKVRMPGTGELVSMSELCKTGGMIDAEKAVELASKTKGKKKSRSKKNSDVQA